MYGLLESIFADYANLAGTVPRSNNPNAAVFGSEPEFARLGFIELKMRELDPEGILITCTINGRNISRFGFRSQLP
jgi:hypothetical protein